MQIRAYYVCGGLYERDEEKINYRVVSVNESADRYTIPVKAVSIYSGVLV